jgi:hypothetical protein
MKVVLPHLKASGPSRAFLAGLLSCDRWDELGEDRELRLPEEWGRRPEYELLLIF